MKGEERGFSLLEMMLVASILISLGFFSLSQWRTRLLRLYQAEARQALEHNARFLERWMQESPIVNGARRSWPVLPVTQTGHYRIYLSSILEHTPGRYRLLAVRKDDPDRRFEIYLRLNQNGYIVECLLDGGRERCEDE
jgi:Tfp pilus assembly protein PilE